MPAAPCPSPPHCRGWLLLQPESCSARLDHGDIFKAVDADTVPLPILEESIRDGGIAIPHVKNPIDVGAKDEKPVRARLHLLSRLTWALRQAGFRDQIMGEPGRVR